MHLWLSSFGQSSAQLQAISKGILDMQRDDRSTNQGHAYRGGLSCEGQCSEEVVHFTQHSMTSEVYNKDEQCYEQLYRCTVCNTERRFGLTETRQTLMGVGN